uniref:UBX domain-containing protein n=1 Tax=Heterorhabditis bacteriophora TaxID=37862 RepID=A0A1I7WGZ6_HETBA
MEYKISSFIKDDMESEIFPKSENTDEQVISAKLQCPNGRILHRPINKLYPLEIRAIASSQSIPIDVL